MKLNYKRTLFVGFAFFLICAFWQAYDTIVPKILTDRFGMSQFWSGAIMAIDNILALFLRPLFGILSDKTKSKLGRRTPFIIFGTLIAAGQQSIMANAGYVALFPCMFLILLMLSFNLFGNGLRDAFNPSLRGTED